MSPMLNSRYFQPMVHRPLLDIRKYALLTDQKSEFYAVVKPEGLDVFINDGKFYDFNYNELTNNYLKFHFEAVLKTSIDNKMTILGVLTSSNILHIKRNRHTLYDAQSTTITDITLVIYDVVFPVFNSDHIYKWRYDIADKVLKDKANCRIATKVLIKNGDELNKEVLMLFSIDMGASMLVYKTEGKFVPGLSQLTWEDDDTVSYIVEAKQRYRAHIKKVMSTTLRMENGDKIDVALTILAKFKREFIEIPVSQENLALRRFIWENRKTLKEYPFWFTGYTLLETKNGKTDYTTIINEFLSFIATDKV